MHSNTATGGGAPEKEGETKEEEYEEEYNKKTEEDEEVGEQLRNVILLDPTLKEEFKTCTTKCRDGPSKAWSRCHHTPGTENMEGVKQNERRHV